MSKMSLDWNSGYRFWLYLFNWMPGCFHPESVSDMFMQFALQQQTIIWGTPLTVSDTSTSIQSKASHAHIQGGQHGIHCPHCESTHTVVLEDGNYIVPHTCRTCNTLTPWYIRIQDLSGWNQECHCCILPLHGLQVQWGASKSPRNSKMCACSVWQRRSNCYKKS